MLLTLEMLILTVLIIIIIIITANNLSSAFFLFYFTIIVCEARLGLRLLIFYTRETTGSIKNNFI